MESGKFPFPRSHSFSRQKPRCTRNNAIQEDQTLDFARSKILLHITCTHRIQAYKVLGLLLTSSKQWNWCEGVNHAIVAAHEMDYVTARCILSRRRESKVQTREIDERNEGRRRKGNVPCVGRAKAGMTLLMPHFTSDWRVARPDRRFARCSRLFFTQHTVFLLKSGTTRNPSSGIAAARPRKTKG